jgi:hypothetical protein
MTLGAGSGSMRAKGLTIGAEVQLIVTVDPYVDSREA